jgi:hypothetical protein
MRTRRLLAALTLASLLNIAHKNPKVLLESAA